MLCMLEDIFRQNPLKMSIFEVYKTTIKFVEHLIVTFSNSQMVRARARKRLYAYTPRAASGARLSVYAAYKSH